jgi:hypothetical protein
VQPSGIANIAGLIRRYDIRQGVIRHALGCALDADALKLNWVWPANQQDGDAASTYKGAIPMGSLLFIPQGVAKPASVTDPLGIMIWNAFQQYGCYVFDRAQTTGRRLSLGAEAGTKADCDRLQGTGQLGAIIGQVRRVSNNSTDGITNVGGPGTRVAPTIPAV